MTKKKKMDYWLLFVIIGCIALFIILMGALFYAHIDYQSNQENDYLLITGTASCATLCFLIIYNFGIFRMQSEVKKIQEQEFNLKLNPYLRQQLKDIYLPILSFLDGFDLYSTSLNYNGVVYLSKDAIEIMNKDIDLILEKKDIISQKDLKRILLIKIVFNEVFVPVYEQYNLYEKKSIDQNDINKVKFQIIKLFITNTLSRIDILDKNIMKEIEILMSYDIFKNRIASENRLFPPIFSENDLVFENDRVWVNPDSPVLKQNNIREKLKGKYESNDLIPILSHFTGKEYEYFQKIKNGIGEELDDSLPYDVSKFANEKSGFAKLFSK